MSTSEKCLKCDGSPLQTGECDPRACTTVFPFTDYLTSYIKCPKCGATLDFCGGNVIVEEGNKKTP